MRHTEHLAAVSTLLGLITSVHRDLHHWRSNQQPQYAEGETLPLGHRFLPHISDAELTSHCELSDQRSKWSCNSQWLVNSVSLTCGLNRWPSGRVSVSAYCGCWFDLQWWRSRCTMLMRPNKIETAVQCSVCRMKVFAGFSCHGNSKIYICIYIYIYIYCCTPYIMDSPSSINTRQRSVRGVDQTRDTIPCDTTCVVDW